MVESATYIPDIAEGINAGGGREETGQRGGKGEEIACG